MNRAVGWALSVGLTWGAPGAAQQPFSESLLDCAAITDMLHDRLESLSTGRRDADLAALKDYADRLFLKAVEQAGAEGHTDPFARISAMVPEKQATWRAKGLFWIATQDGKDWMSYCRTFSRHMGVAPPDIRSDR